MGCAGGGGGQVMRTLRLLLLIVLALAAIEYLYGSFLEVSPLRIYLTPIYNAAQPFIKFGNRSAAMFKAGRNNTLNINSKDITKSDHDTEVKKKLNEEITFFHESMTQVVTQTEPLLPYCNLTQESELLGPVHIDTTPVPINNTRANLDALGKKFPELRKGGRYSPRNCTAVHKVAIIVPFRNRYIQLPIFLNHMHSFLMKQQIEYGIFVIDQEGRKKFNRAKLFNVGFVEAQLLKAGGWQCFIFHDIDLLPMDTRNLYTCPRQPRHMSASIDKHKFRLPYNEIFGGVSALTLKQFKKVNGFSNNYWGWGGEDDDMFYSPSYDKMAFLVYTALALLVPLNAALCLTESLFKNVSQPKELHKEGYSVERYNLSIARYTSLPHKKSMPNPKRYKLLSKVNPEHDGLSTLNYHVVYVLEHHLYTHIQVNIDEGRRHKPALKDGPFQDFIHRFLFLGRDE